MTSILLQVKTNSKSILSAETTEAEKVKVACILFKTALEVLQALHKAKPLLPAVVQDLAFEATTAFSVLSKREKG